MRDNMIKMALVGLGTAVVLPLGASVAVAQPMYPGYQDGVTIEQPPADPQPDPTYSPKPTFAPKPPKGDPDPEPSPEPEHPKPLGPADIAIPLPPPVVDPEPEEDPGKVIDWPDFPGDCGPDGLTTPPTEEPKPVPIQEAQEAEAEGRVIEWPGHPGDCEPDDRPDDLTTPEGDPDDEPEDEPTDEPDDRGGLPKTGAGMAFGLAGVGSILIGLGTLVLNELRGHL